MSPLPATVGVDVGGTTVKVGVLAGGRLVDTAERPTPRDPDVLSGTLAELVLPRVSRHDATAVGVVVPGVVDEHRGVGVLSATLGWRDAPLRALFTERLGIPVALGHDVRAAALAELGPSAPSAPQDAAFVALGTGLSAALVLDGRIRAAGGLAGELGHCDVGHGQLCPCGATGCLEVLASGAGMARRLQQRTGEPVVGAEDVARRAAAGDAAARAVWDDAVDALSHGLAWLVGIAAPEVVVVGGGVAAAGAQLLEPLSERLDQRLSFHRRPVVRAARWGADAARVGAALLAQERT